MKKKASYIVLVPEVHYSHMRVQASSKEEAIRLVQEGEGEQVIVEYSHTLEESDGGKWRAHVEGEDPITAYT